MSEKSIKINIAYIDESSDERDNFFTDAYQSKIFENIYLLAPSMELNDLIDELMELEIDALVTDFNLFEGASLGYTGEDVVSGVLKKKSDFPCFIRTAYNEYALNSTHDVNKIYSKNVVHDESNGRYLFDRIKIQVKNYTLRIESWKNELGQLLDDSSRRDAGDIQRIIELDSKIESCLGGDVAIPKHIKKELFMRGDALFEETERLVAEIKRALES